MTGLELGSDVTRLLDPGSGGRKSLDELVPLVYHELKRLAHARLRFERADHTLTTTALVHEAYLRLAEVHRVRWQDRAHFLAMASRVMHRVLVEYARRRTAQKRGGRQCRVELDEEQPIPDPYAAQVLELHDALVRLEEINPRLREILEQRYFGGLTLEETAEALDLSLTTVKRELRFAKAWLSMEMSTEPTL